MELKYTNNHAPLMTMYGSGSALGVVLLGSTNPIGGWALIKIAMNIILVMAIASVIITLLIDLAVYIRKKFDH